MACTPSATETQFATIISTSLSTTFTDSVQTLPGVETTVVTTSCLSTVSDACVASTEVDVVSTLPGEVTTIQVPFIITAIVTDSEPTLTLFASCSTTSSVSSSPSPSNTPSPSVSPTSSAPGSSSSQVSGAASPAVASDTSYTGFSSTSPSTPSPTVMTEQTSTTLANGSVVVEVTEITSTPPPTAVGSPSAAQPSQSTQQDNAGGSSSNLPPILGGVIGGFFGLIGLVALIWFIFHRHRRYSDIEEEVVPYPVTRVKDRQLDLDNEPKPYQYGLVGRPNSVATSATSPPNTPPASSSLNHFSRTPQLNNRDSITPLMLPEAYYAAGSTTPEMLSSGSSSPHMQRQRRISRADELDSRPVSVATAPISERRLSRASLGQLNVSLPAADNNDYFGLMSDADRTSGLGSPRSIVERRDLQVVNAPLSPSSTVASLMDSPRTVPLQAPLVPFVATRPSTPGTPPPRPEKSSRRPRLSQPGEVIVHKDGGRVPDDRVSVTGSMVAGGSTLPQESPPPPEYRE
ncbi:hypothetical protein DENSPDRAFT_834806 [Dentipellis sp. KUC8613]|nr:hypothetical protein DENSPDRAFT_834806 [Dentipellis sp. KUC8613]